MLSSFWTGFLKFLEKDQKNIPILYSLLNQLKPVELTEKKIVLGCSNQGLKFFLEKKVFDIKKALYEYVNKRLSVEFVVANQSKKKHSSPLLNFQPSIGDLFTKAGLHIKYNFDNFAVSPTNQVAYAACQAVAENLGSAYNPLFLYGGVGVGKTHLAQAVGKKILEKYPEKKVFFCPGDQFTNELIESIREKTTPTFRRKYRRLNLLIVDDVQFIAGKQTIQEEFFHTFNTVVSVGGQIILTSDRPPSEIKSLEDRLRSRFSGGLTVDIQTPDFELRTAILLIKAKEKNVEIDIEAAKKIADQTVDTRALEGVLLSVCARVLGKKDIVDVEAVDGFFNEKKTARVKKITPHDVIMTICSYYNVKQSRLKGAERSERIALPRQIAMYLLRNKLELKFDEVAALLKRKDHTTVMHGVEKISGLLAKDVLFKQEVDRIIGSLNL